MERAAVPRWTARYREAPVFGALFGSTAARTLAPLMNMLAAGTALWTFVSMRRSARAVSHEYLDALAQAEEQVTLPWLRYVLVSAALVLVNGGVLSIASFMFVLSFSAS